MSSSAHVAASGPRAQTAADDLSLTPAAVTNIKRARDEPSSTLDEQVRAAKRQRSTAIAVAQAMSEFEPGLADGAIDAVRFKALDAFVTLALLGQPAPVQQLRQVLVKFQGRYSIGATFAKLTEAAQFMCAKVSPVNLQLLRELLQELLSCKPSVMFWPFVSALSTCCDVALSSTVRAQYIEVLRAAFTCGVDDRDSEGMLKLLRALTGCGFDVDQRNKQGNTLLLQCVSAEYAGNEVLLPALMDLGATMWASNSVNKRTVLHIWMQQHRFDIVRDILLEQSPWGNVLPLFDWWAPDEKGRTPLQLAQEKAGIPFQQNSYDRLKTEIEGAIAVTKLLPALLQHWKQTERPLLVHLLVEHASLCADVAQLVLSYVDGQERA
jgi:hypothetical protein